MVKPGEDVYGGSASPTLLRFRSSKGLIGFTVFTAAFTDGFLCGLVVPVLPFALVQRVGVAVDTVQFWTSLLLVIFGMSTVLGAPAAAWLADHTSSRRLPFLIGLMLAFAATVFFMIGTFVWMLVVGRCLQGLSAGVVYTTGLSLLVDTVSRDEIGSWMGFALSGMNLGVLISPFLAGIVYEKAGYYPVFAMALVVIAFDFFLRLLMIEKKAARKWLDRKEAETYRSHSEVPPAPQDPTAKTSAIDDSNDFAGRVDSASQDQSERGPNEPGIINATNRPQPDEESPLLGNRQPRPENLFQRRFPTMAALLSSSQIVAAVYGCFVNASLVSSFDAVLPLFVQHTFHWNAGGAGAIFLCLTIPSLLGPAIGALADRYGPRPLALVGFALTTPCFVLLGLVKKDTLTEIIVFAILLTLIGLGLNLFLSPLAADLSFTVERLDKENSNLFGPAGACAQAYSLFNCALGAGTVFGPTVSGLLYHNTTWAITGGMLALICFSGSIPVLLYTSRSQRDYQPMRDSKRRSLGVSHVQRME